MQSAHCQSRVNNAINAIAGVKIERLEAGKLAVSVESDEIKEEMVAVIEKAGYKVEGNDNGKTSTCSTGCCD